MSDLRHDLRRASRLAPDSTLDLERLHMRRERIARRKRSSAIGLSLAITAALVGTAFVVSTGRARTGSADGDPAGGRTIIAGPTVDLSLAPGEYSYRQVTTYPTEGEPSTLAVWWGPDGSGRVRYSADDDTRYGPGQIATDAGPIAYLSTDPNVLLTQMIERTSPGGRSPEPMDEFTPGPGQSDHLTAGLIRAIGELLDDTNSSPELRAALCQVTSGLEGVQVTLDAVDPVGRPAVLLSVTTEEVLHRWWFDPTSLQVLARDDGSGAGSEGVLRIVEHAGVVAGDDSTELLRPFVPAGEQQPGTG
jgi:hypothetical protein